MWERIDLSLLENPPARLVDSDHCYCAREYTSRKGYAHSETNNLISNFKKPVSDRGTARWKYKRQAIEQFASELYQLLSGVDWDYYIAAVPSSKCRTDPDHDNRLEAVIDLLLRRCRHGTKAAPVIRTHTIAAAHLSGTTRPSPSQVRDSLAWAGLPGALLPVLFVDDVLTTGTTFKECQRLVQENLTDADVIGIFWARTVWED